jgi:hypothetical protein
MRRAALGLAGTAAGTVFLVAAKIGPAPAGGLVGAPAGPGVVPPPGVSVPAGAPPPSGGPGNIGIPPGSPTGSATLPPSGPPRPGLTSTPPGGGGGTPPPTTARPPQQTFTGTAVRVITAQSPSVKSQPCGECHDYTISVTITVSGGRVSATSVAYNPSPGGSLSYASRANNALSSAILTAQTWNLGRVSGATYAGNAWELSVKDAMGKAGLPV